jgi:GH25 family lysozyme M1 (1,4-beta-N-acetylmuramidase)
MQPMPPLNAVIDISHYNRDPVFTAARQGVGVIHKATQGADGVDPTYAANRAQAQAAGLMWGAYHFATATTRRRRRGTSSPWPAPIPAPSSPSTSSTIPPDRA